MTSQRKRSRIHIENLTTKCKIKTITKRSLEITERFVFRDSKNLLRFSKMVNYDEEFAGLLQNAGHLVPFMDAFFGFLYRRTDFFCIKSGADDQDGVVGFPEGSAEKILLSVFRRYQTHAKNERENLEKLSSASVPEPSQEVEVTDASSTDVDFEPIPNVTGKFKCLRDSSYD
jgi:hypothetical protein